MNRLVSFGCSHTFGEGLPDALVNQNAPGAKIPWPSKYAWPAVLGKIINKPVINLGTPGESNKFICNHILNSYLNKDDVVIVMWTYFTRSCIFADDFKTFRLIPSNTQGFAGVSKEKQKINRQFYKNFFFYKNAFIESYQSINYTKLYLDKIGVRNYHFCVEEYPYYDKDHDKSLTSPIWNQADLHYVKFLEDYASDGDHYSPAAHKHMAEQIYKKIKL